MNWFREVFFEHTPLQAIVVISLISAIGLGLRRVHFKGISLGVTFIFLAGILAGHLGLSVDEHMLHYAESFGLVIFVYALGLQVGPGFFSSFRSGGMKLNLIAFFLVILGTGMALLLGRLGGISLADISGLLSGATTNTPALGAAQQTLIQLGMPTNSAALACALTYPFGVVGVILCIWFIKLFTPKKQLAATVCDDEERNTYIAVFQVTNPAVFNKSIYDVAHLYQTKYVISRLWRDGHVCIPTSDMLLQRDDRIMIITQEKDVTALTVLFGTREEKNWNKKDIDWNAIDRELESESILVTRRSLNGKRLGSLKLRNAYGVNVSRVFRAGMPLLATPDLVLQLGDRLIVVGNPAGLKTVQKLLGNRVQNLKEPYLFVVFFGIVLGLMLGNIPFMMPGVSVPVRLGLAGGPIIMGILLGTFGPRIHMITYTTRSANLMLRSLGLSTYLACLGIDAGAEFFHTVFRPEGLLWIGTGLAITIVPTFIVGMLALRYLKLDFGTMAGMLCGGMANPMALTFVNETIPGDNPSVAYATVYPLCMFARVVIAQVMLVLLLT